MSLIFGKSGRHPPETQLSGEYAFAEKKNKFSKMLRKKIEIVHYKMV